jgi:tetratricopeptide (TPR) repeat protein
MPTAKDKPELMPPRETKLVMLDEPGVQAPSEEIDRARGIFLGELAPGNIARNQDREATKRAREAVDLLLEAVKRVPDDVEAHFVLGKVYEALEKPELAVESWERTLELSPKHVEAMESLATLYHQFGQLESARGYYERLIEVDPMRPNQYGRLAHVLGRLGETKKGIEVAEKCLTLNPSLVQTHLWLIEAYRKTGDETRAQEHERILKQFQSAKKLR